MSINIDLPSTILVHDRASGPKPQAFPEEAVVPEPQYEGERRVACRGAAAGDETPESRHGFVREPRPYARVLYMDPAATLDNLFEAVKTLEDTARIGRRVLGGANPTTWGLDRALETARAALRAREETPSGGA